MVRGIFPVGMRRIPLSLLSSAFPPGIITLTPCGFACAAVTVALSGIIGAWLTLPLMLIPVGLIALRRFPMNFFLHVFVLSLFNYYNETKK